MAADIPAKVYSPASPCCVSWDGFYFGVHGGYGWKRNNFEQVLSTNPLVTIGGIDSKGWVFGGQAGYNWQYGSWVAGLEIDFSTSGIRGETPLVTRNPTPDTTLSERRGDDVQYLGTARARLGFAPLASLLIYGTAGLAWERVDRTIFTSTLTPANLVTVLSRQPNDRFGWVAGVGGEAKLFGSNWIGRVEYLHYDFGTVERTVTSDAVGADPRSFSDSGGRQTIDLVRAGVSYKFCGDCGPVRAAY